MTGCCLLFAFFAAALDPSSEVLVRWPATDTSAPELARQAGVVAVAEIGQAAGEAELEQQINRARQAGFAAVSYPAFAAEPVLRAFAARQAGITQFVCLKPDQIGWNVAPAHAVLLEGQWPGRERQDPSVASATNSPWINANTWLPAWLRARFPGRAALIQYPASEDGSLDLALLDARAGGGNVLLPHGDFTGLAATLRFLKQHERDIRPTPSSRVAVVPGSLDDDGEILNMLFRRNVSPAVLPAASMPASAGPVKILIASRLTGSEQEKALSFAGAGGTVITAGAKPWWPAGRVKQTGKEEERDLFQAGKGRIIAYREAITDPDAFAFDVIETLGWQTRDLRLWGAGSTIGTLHRAPGGRLAVLLVNYDKPYEGYFLVRVEGAFRKARLFEPDWDGGVDLRAAHRGTGTELELPGINRVALIVME